MPYARLSQLVSLVLSHGDKQEYSNMPVPRNNDPVSYTMGEYKRGSLHSGKGGKRVKSRKQAIAIALSRKRRGEGKRTKKRSSGRR